MISNDTCFLWINDLNLVTFSLPATPDTPADTRGHCLIWQEVPSFGEGKGCHIGTTQANQRIKSLKCCFIWNSYGKTHEDCVRSSLNLLYAYCGSQDGVSQVTTVSCVCSWNDGSISTHCPHCFHPQSTVRDSTNEKTLLKRNLKQPRMN